MFCRLYLASASLTAEPRVQMPMLPKQSLSCLTSRPTITESFRAMEGRSSGQRTKTLMDSGVMPLLRKCKILRDAQTQLQSRQSQFQPHRRLQHHQILPQITQFQHFLPNQQLPPRANQHRLPQRANRLRIPQRAHHPRLQRVNRLRLRWKPHRAVFRALLALPEIIRQHSAMDSCNVCRVCTWGLLAVQAARYST